MPNWCSNDLIVYGEDEELERFHALFTALDIGGEAHPFENIYPTPATRQTPVVNDSADAAFTALAELNGYDWYSWHCDHWGTKWDINEPESEVFPGQILYRFDTAWGPPIKWLQHIYHNWPKLTFEMEFEEEGNGIKGSVRTDEDGNFYG
jgi:hypothetical protein